MSGSQRKKRSFNIWKYICLTIFLLIGGVFVYFAFFIPSESGYINQKPLEQSEEKTLFKVEATREHANRMIDLYLADKNKADNVHYDIDLREDGLYVSGDITYFGMTYPFEMKTTPNVLDNGNVRLDIESITVSNFELPRELILTILSTRDTFPEFIVFNAEENYIGVNLNELKLDNGVSFGAEVINLAADQIQLVVYLPMDHLQ